MGEPDNYSMWWVLLIPPLVGFLVLVWHGIARRYGRQSTGAKDSVNSSTGWVYGLFSVGVRLYGLVSLMSVVTAVPSLAAYRPSLFADSFTTLLFIQHCFTLVFAVVCLSSPRLIAKIIRLERLGESPDIPTTTGLLQIGLILVGIPMFYGRLSQAVRDLFGSGSLGVYSALWDFTWAFIFAEMILLAGPLSRLFIRERVGEPARRVGDVPTPDGTE